MEKAPTLKELLSKSKKRPVCILTVLYRLS